MVDGPMPLGQAPDGDALVTTTRGLGLMVRVADCVPVVLADAEAGVIGAVHSGRPGLVLDIATRTVEVMRAHGASDIVAWVGPHVCGSCYEVPEQMRADVSAVVPEAWAETSWGTPALDIGAGVRAQLSPRGRRGRRRRRLHPRGARPALLPSRRRRRRTLRRAGVDLVTRADDLAANLAVVRRRIADACAAVGRSPDDVSLVVVTKFFPASDVRALADLGVTDVGENRHQEAADKAAECADLGLRWHFIGASRATRPPPSRRTPTWSSRSTAASWSVPSTAGRGERHGRRAPAGQPRPAGVRPPGRRRPRDPGRPGAPPSRRPSTCGCAA